MPVLVPRLPPQVLTALSDGMPLHLAHSTLSRMISSVSHKRRQGQVRGGAGH